jgi:hypothetical protein
LLSQKQFGPVQLIGDQMVAITKWLKSQSRNVDVSIRGALLSSKLSDDELWYWSIAIEQTRDLDLLDFLRRLGIDRKRLRDPL